MSENKLFIVLGFISRLIFVFFTLNIFAVGNLTTVLIFVTICSKIFHRKDVKENNSKNLLPVKFIFVQ